MRKYLNTHPHAPTKLLSVDHHRKITHKMVHGCVQKGQAGSRTGVRALAMSLKLSTDLRESYLD